ncbi:pentapeptide repeat-containing protein [Rugosimonospora africana]|uniref:Pentapeptide repeat-containing protein n=1 Tax=Rugosimonospora africana TaxID=556532 RepID=A0A8J3VQV4_9ACTN|nr:pentapeptide repeat-containing protein [Rugosimonospora africana]GIH15520.1 hypothetical protein Raf01_36920 [Rugosimonospora africana]
MRSQESTPPVEERLVLNEVDLTRADFSGRRIQRFGVTASRFTECDFSGVRIFKGGSFGAGGDYTEYLGCVFDQAELTRVNAGRARFVNCSFRDVRIRDMFSHDGEFVDCLFTGRIEGAVFNGRPPSYEGMAPNPKKLLEFRGNDFSGAVLEDVGFRNGVALSQQSLPTGPDYVLLLDAGPVLRRAWDLAEALPAADPHRGSIRSALRLGLDELANGQQDFFRTLMNRKDVAGGRALLALLADASAEIAAD